MRPLSMKGGMRETVVRALSRNELFGTLQDEQLVKIAEMARLVQTGPGEVLMEEGDEGYTFFVVLSGSVTVRKGADAEVVHLGPSDMVGEMSMLLMAPRSATVVTEGSAVLLEFEPIIFEVMFNQIPGFGMAVARALARRLNETTKHLAS